MEFAEKLRRDEFSVEVNDLKFRYLGSSRFALNGVSFRVRKGEFFTIIGPNGAGKTTLALCLVGVIPHYIEGELSGNIVIDGIDVGSRSIPEIAMRVGLVMQDPETQIIGITVKDDVAFGPCNLGLDRHVILDRVSKALRMVRMQGYENRETARLSGGEKQRVAIASILALHPDIIVADEPTSQLDPIGKREVFETLLQLNKSEGKTVIMITHDIDWAVKYSDRIGLLYFGKFVFIGSPRDLLSKIGIDGLANYGINPPQIPTLYLKLVEKGVLKESSSMWLSVEEASLELRKILQRKNSKRSSRQEHKFEQDKENDGREAVIIVKDLWHVYPGGIQALKGVSLEIYKGEIVAIVGQNGSGKTTLVKHFNGLLKPTEGYVSVFGMDTRKKSISELSRKVGYVFQNPDNQIFSSSVREEVMFGLKNMGYPIDEIEKKIDWALSFVGLKGLEEEHPFKLSKAERQLLAFASILAMEPEIIIVDEPTTGQDWNGTLKMMNMLRELNNRGHTIIIVTHDMNIVANYATRMVVLHGGYILTEGKPRDLFYQIDLLSQTYLEPPPLVLLVNSLKDCGISFRHLTIDEVVEEICARLGVEGGWCS
ncbi:MAG: energy-coupling factor transporter ATPase [Candidatus Bathyarchaeia archaeon]